MGSRSSRAVTVLVVSLLVLTQVLAGAVGAADPADDRDSDVRSAIEESREHLLSEQDPSGRWVSPLRSGKNGSVDVRQTLYYGLMLEHLDVEPENKSLAIDWVLSQRRPDGGWNDSEANFAALLLLEQQDGNEYDEVIADVRRENDRLNFSLSPTGSAVRTPTRYVRALAVLMSDRYEVEDLFRQATIDRSRYRLEAMQELYDAREIGGIASLEDLEEIPPAPNRTGEDRTNLVPATVDTLLAVSMVITREHDGGEASELLDDAASILLDRRLPTGAYASVRDTVFATVALYESGYEPTDRELRLTRQFLSGERLTENGRQPVLRLPLWDTAWSIRALRMSGVDRHNESLERGALWLYDGRVAPLERREADPPVDSRPVQFRPVQGSGWGYKPHMYADWDDTAVAISALEPYGRSIVRDDVELLFRAQQEDGSWTAYTAPASGEWEEPKELMETLFESAFSTDDSAPDITGHVLMALAATGYTVENNESVRDAVDWYRRTRDDDGLWRGVWGEGPTYGTSRAVRGMVAVGVPQDDPVVRDAVRGMIATQNPDGGWGPHGSSPTHTAWAVQTLLAGGTDPGNPAVRAGIDYLLDTQREDGSWARGKPMRWRNYVYSLTIFTQAAALQALVMYADAAGIDYAPDQDDDADSTANLIPIVGLGLPAVVALLALAVSRRRP